MLSSQNTIINISQMDIENNPIFPLESNFLLKDHFLYNGINAELYVYENHIVFATQF